jgi:hypothetical protein
MRITKSDRKVVSFSPLWAAGFVKHPRPEVDVRKTLVGNGNFNGVIAVSFAAGAIAELGGWG